jgi:hypothetical protein
MPSRRPSGVDIPAAHVATAEPASRAGSRWGGLTLQAGADVHLWMLDAHCFGHFAMLHTSVLSNSAE